MSGGETSSKLVFVIHKHKATSLHYDFRLEIGGVMPSWSIPKGPTLDSRPKRLAMPTGDHALPYRNFEGNIAKGEYGAGPVMIWDQGTYDPEDEPRKGVRTRIQGRKEAEAAAAGGLEAGNLKFFLYGDKLKGSFALVKAPSLGKKFWLLIKHRDEYSAEGYDANDYDFSAVTHRSLGQIAGDQTLI
ncbi:MAG TPA: DNA polymerase ligase N-terminal domain-containing protein [Nitrososphaerales archaeon]|nr:DNA polymerase ligase N-terminal domain-containing protein [Nitrososphaerales archaeon]